MTIFNCIILILVFCTAPAGVLWLCKKVPFLGKIGPVLLLYILGVIIGNIGIRPEGFVLDENGPLTCKLTSLEVMGRDVSVVSENAASLNPVVRSIINADNKVDVTAENVKYSLKAHKVFIFNKETEERIDF